MPRKATEIEVKKALKQIPRWIARRDELICKRAATGEAHESISKDYGISRERVRQIVRAAELEVRR